MKYRSRTDIISDILESARDGAIQTRIMYSSYLSFAQIKEYLIVLLHNGLLEFNKELKVYKTTSKGLAYIKTNEAVSKILNVAEN